jgi:hypothetical protein
MLHSLYRQAESSPVIHQEVRYNVNRPLKSQAHKKLQKFFLFRFYGKGERFLAHHSIRYTFSAVSAAHFALRDSLHLMSE